MECLNLQEISIPHSIQKMDAGAFNECYNLESKPGLYKAFKPDMTCKNYQYEIGKTSKYKGDVKIYESGFHYVTNMFDLFNYYSGEYGKDFIICEVEVGKISKERANNSKRVCKKLTPIKKLEFDEVIDILNNVE